MPAGPLRVVNPLAVAESWRANGQSELLEVLGGYRTGEGQRVRVNCTATWTLTGNKTDGQSCAAIIGIRPTSRRTGQRRRFVIIGLSGVGKHACSAYHIRPRATAAV